MSHTHTHTPPTSVCYNAESAVCKQPGALGLLRAGREDAGKISGGRGDRLDDLQDHSTFVRKTKNEPIYLVSLGGFTLKTDLSSS